jgi:D-psicose/D-tagatose/L-ribulose 3-epimerase
MKFGVNTFIWSAQFGPEQYSLLGRIREHGFDGAELPLIDPQQLRPAELRRELSNAGLECTFCSVLPKQLSTITADKQVRANTREHLKTCIGVAAEAGGKIIGGPLYSPVGYFSGQRRTSEEWSRSVELFQSLGDVLTDSGVTYAIEPLNRFETYFLNTASDVRKFCGEINHPNIGVLFDTFHANIEERDVAEACRSLGPHLKHVHTCENDRGTPGTGHVDWNAFFRALKSMSYDGWLTIESFGFSLGELSAAASIWRDLAPEAENIAFDGVQFVKQCYRAHCPSRKFQI